MAAFGVVVPVAAIMPTFPTTNSTHRRYNGAAPALPGMALLKRNIL